MGDRQWFVLYVLICLEVGIFLTLVPWSLIWERNYFLQVYPALRPVLLDPTLRGAVSGLGVANIYLVLHELLERRPSALATTELLPDGLHLIDGAGRDAERSNEHTSSGEGSQSSRPLAIHEEKS